MLPVFGESTFASPIIYKIEILNFIDSTFTFYIWQLHAFLVGNYII